MAYVENSFYKELYGSEISDSAFSRFEWETARLMDRETTGVDGFKKLRYAFPTDEDDVMTVRRCACAVINILHQIDEYNRSVMDANGYIKREDGTLSSNVISSISSGSESISFSNSVKTDNVIISAAKSTAEKNLLIHNTITEFLSGAADANGINLLYTGVYPCLNHAT